MASIVYLNGCFLERAKALIPVDDGGWLHGAGLFETMRAENSRVFQLDAHLDRLCRSATALIAPVQREDLPGSDVISELLQRNDLRTARLRLTLSADGMRQSPDADHPTFNICLTASRLDGYPRECYTRGVSVAVCDTRVSPSDPIAGHKTTCYLPRLIGLRQAQQAKCSEAIWFTTEHQLAEGCISNVLLIKNSVLHTPPLDTPVLPGIARSVVLDIARDEKIKVCEEPLTIDELLDADEVVLTNSIMQVMPVTRVERHAIGDETVGPIARLLLERFRDRVKTECKPS